MGKEYITKVLVLDHIARPLEALIFDDIEDEVKWVASGEGVDYVFEKSNDRARSGSYSMHLKTKVTTPAIGDWAMMGRQVPTRPQRYLKLLTTFFNPATELEQYYRLQMEIVVGEYWGTPHIRYDFKNGTLEYRDKDNVWRIIAETDIRTVPYAAGELELQIDSLKRQYVSVRMNNEEINLVGIPYRTVENTDHITGIGAKLSVETKAAFQGEVYFDDVLLAYID